MSSAELLTSLSGNPLAVAARFTEDINGVIGAGISLFLVYVAFVIVRMIGKSITDKANAIKTSFDTSGILQKQQELGINDNTDDITAVKDRLDVIEANILHIDEGIVGLKSKVSAHYSKADIKTAMTKLYNELKANQTDTAKLSALILSVQDKNRQIVDELKKDVYKSSGLLTGVTENIRAIMSQVTPK